MKRGVTLLAAPVLSLILLAPLCVQAIQGGADSGSQTITITRAGSQPSRNGPAEHFTGSVRVDYLFQPSEPSRTSGAFFTFEPGTPL